MKQKPTPEAVEAYRENFLEPGRTGASKPQPNPYGGELMETSKSGNLWVDQDQWTPDLDTLVKASTIPSGKKCTTRDRKSVWIRSTKPAHDNKLEFMVYHFEDNPSEQGRLVPLAANMDVYPAWDMKSKSVVGR